MGFQFRRLRLRVETPSGEFGTDLEFSAGLNILAASNTAGKSTCIQALLFAFGLEGMLGPGREVPLPHAMTHAIEDADGHEEEVLSSQVLLEIADDSGRPVTIRRHPKHARIDTNLVSVWEGPLPNDPDELGVGRDFFVRRQGAAQREAGFYHFLAQRLGWQLPLVPRFQGPPVPLYLETLAPLWFVEQKRGWAGLQTQTPTYMGIRDVRRRAIEFTLALDVQELATRTEALLGEQRELQAEWSGVVAGLEASSSTVGASIESLPRRPLASWPPDPHPRLTMASVDGWQELDDKLRESIETLSRLEASGLPSAGAATSTEQRVLIEMEQQLQQLALLSSEHGRMLELEQATARDAQARVSAVEEDIRRHQDLLVLENMGSDVEHSINRTECPTCHQALADVLLDPADIPSVLAAEASVELLQQQRQLFQALAQDADRVVGASESRMAALRSTAADLRTSIRAVKDSLTGLSTAPSAATIEQIVSLRRRIDELQTLRDEWLIGLERLGELSQRWAALLDELNLLREGELTDADREKLTALEASFRVQLGDYGFASCPIDQVGLARDDYMPTHEGFELALDFSASDGIRMIWAYLMGLLEVARTHHTNHPGVVVFDEPRQQAAAEVSFSRLLGRAASVAGRESQVLFATSEAAPALASMLHDIDANLLQYNRKVIQRLNGP